MKLCSIRSSSKGNAILVYTEKTKLLVDCGISGKLAKEGMNQLGIEPELLNGILITHEHQDHIGGVGVMSRRYGLPIFANQKTWDAMESSLGCIEETNKCVFSTEESFQIGDITVKPFAIPHDAAEPVGYSFVCGEKKLSIATDIGVLEESIFRAVKGSKGILLEANHDRNLLDIGSYPQSLKQRIRGERGHLSNEEAGLAAKFLSKMGTAQIMLGHMSHENNYPLLAAQTVENILRDSGIEPGRDLQLSIAPRDRISNIMAI
jgi:phosphoribosyl 1,2-cyclic phosphodiesterase